MKTLASAEEDAFCTEKEMTAEETMAAVASRQGKEAE